MATLRNRRGKGDHPSQLTISNFLAGVAAKAETRDPAQPALCLLGVVVAMMGFGVLIQASHAATIHDPEGFSNVVMEQVSSRGVALLAILIGYRMGPAGIRRFIPLMTAFALVILVLCYIEPFSIIRNGARRWIDLGVSFQPSEVARMVILLWIADRCVKLGDRVSEFKRGVMPMLALVLVFFALVLGETDLGGALLLLICALSTMWVGGARTFPMAALAAFGGGVFIAATAFIPYVRNRVDLWFGEVQNLQVTEAVRAISGGGFWGTGLGQGTARVAGVPYLQSDYVFAQIGEEFGLFGMLLVLGLILAYLWFSLRLVLSLQGRFEALAAFGLLVSVGIQAMLHVQVVSGLAPPKGTILPFISDGGTSLAVSSLAIGLALGSARKKSKRTTSNAWASASCS
ncbi:MAG: cell division protein FtsW [Planctomycetota bacterium]|jgi:cell division protein FtsW